MKVVFSSNISWSIYNFRLSLLKSLQDEGHEICTVAFKDDYSIKLIEEGFKFEHISLNNNSRNLVEDIKVIFKYYKIYKKINPDVICHNAIKPNIYGTIAARLLNIPIVNNISGLGTLFIKKSFSTLIAIQLYKFSQQFANRVIFQNPDDKNLFINHNIIDASRCHIVQGSGVDTTKFVNTRLHVNREEFSFLFVGRLIKDKGILEFIEASRMVKLKYPNIQFNILGPLYLNNSTAVTKSELNSWVLKEKIVNYLGETDDVITEMQNTDCLVLPSYREGLSRVLIEASSMSLPIITSNVPGCKDVVVDQLTGFLCKPKDAIDLYDKMMKMLMLDKNERLKMGHRGRERVLEKFDINIINSIYKKIIKISSNS